MKKVSISQANLVLGSLRNIYDYYSNPPNNFLFQEVPDKSKNSVPKYFTAEYMTKIIQGKISVPKLPDPGNIKLVTNTSSFQVLEEIESVIKTKNGLTSGFDVDQLPKKQYLAKYLHCLDATNKLIQPAQNEEEEKVDIPNEQVFNIFSKTQNNQVSTILAICKYQRFKTMQGPFRSSPQAIKKRIEQKQLRRKDRDEATVKRQELLIKKKEQFVRLKKKRLEEAKARLLEKRPVSIPQAQVQNPHRLVPENEIQ